MTENLEPIDQLNQLLVAAEQKFCLRFDVAAKIQLHEPIVTLSYKRHDGEWRLIVHHPDSTVLLVKSSRAIRVELSRYLPSLWDECLRVEAESQEAVAKAISQVEEFINAHPLSRPKAP